MMTQEELCQRIKYLAEKGYCQFTRDLIPNAGNVLGVRMPRLREIAKEMAQEENWKEYISWSTFTYFEEIMMQGLTLVYVEAPIEEVLVEVERFIPRIGNWSVNDSFCTTFYIARKHREEVWDFLMRYKDSHNEFEVRVVSVMLLSHFLVPEYIDRVLEVLCSLDTSTYYASTGVAWALSAAWAEFPEKTRAYLEEHPVDKETSERTRRKCIESRRIPEEEKAKLRRRKKGTGGRKSGFARR